MFSKNLKLIFLLLNFFALCNINSCNLIDNNRQCVRSVTTSSGILSKKGPYCSNDLIFNDEFNQLNLNLWQHENTLAGGGNWEFQWYTNNRSNSFTKDGILHIRPTLTADLYGEQFLTSGIIDLNGGAPADQCTNPSNNGCNRIGSPTHILNPVRSARMRTVEFFNFKYGKLEVRAKLPAGDWLWPAIWLLPKRNAYGSWPASGEIDLLESRGNRELYQGDTNIGVEQFGTTLHYGPDPSHNGWPKANFLTNSLKENGFDKDFHVYSFIWSPDSFQFYLDGNKIGEFNANDGFFKKGEFPEYLSNPWKFGTKMAPFDEEFYILLNLAVGGTNGFFPDNARNPKQKPWANSSPQAMTDFWNGKSEWLPTWHLNDNDNADFQFDYVRVYAL